MADTDLNNERMNASDALRVVAELRTKEIVITTMGAARDWPKLSDSPLDFHYLPSAMGHAPMIGLGLALARPEHEVIVFNGDGCTLMSLGCLATVVASGAGNLTVFILDNGIYEVTGGQKTAAAGQAVDFRAVAQACGFPTAVRYRRLDEWRREAGDVLARPGPRVIVLDVAPVGAAYHLPTPGPLPERMARFRAALSAE